MKKNILFVMESMKSGGGEKSLLTLLQLFDYSRYDVDLMLFNPSGLFFDMIPPQVNIVPIGGEYEAFSQPLTMSLKRFLLKGKISLAVKRFLYSRAVNSGTGSSLYRDQLSWKFMREAMPTPRKKYDAAIGYLEGKPNFFVADCVDAKVKIGYIHSDYPKLKTDKEFDRNIFEKLDYVVGVSDECVKALGTSFPEQTGKFVRVENITSHEILVKLSDYIPEEFKNKKEGKTILTVGRISAPKGYDIAIDAAEILDKKGYDFKWFSIGKGELQKELEQRIKEKNLQDKFVFLGERANPYPYINGCDIYVQSSYYEGKSIAIDEAKCLAKPIVTTKFTTVHDQLCDGETALLAEIDAESVAEKIEQLFLDENLSEKLKENLKKEKHGNEEEIEKFYALLGEK